MKDKTKVIILSVGMGRDELSGEMFELPIEMLEATADEILSEQEKCELCRRDGAVARLILAYAELIGYEDAYFVEAREYK